MTPRLMERGDTARSNKVRSKAQSQLIANNEAPQFANGRRLLFQLQKLLAYLATLLAQCVTNFDARRPFFVLIGR